MKPKPIVAIDGPAGSGKSTIAKMLARRLGFIHIDTGALYRGVALVALRARINANDERAVVAEAGKHKFEFRQLPEGNLLHIDGDCVQREIRDEAVGQAASKVSALAGVRQMLLGLQRELGRGGGVVLEGRDIGTVVFPAAEVKLFLTASIEERARRRSLELSAKGQVVDLERVKLEMTQRDKQDSEREIAPLRQAADALLVDTTNLSIESVLDRLELLVNESSKAGK